MTELILKEKLREKAGHYYTDQGDARYDANITTARKERLLPSPTTILGSVSNYTLTQWMKRNAASAALDSILEACNGNRLGDFIAEIKEPGKRAEHLDRILHSADSVAKDAAAFGTDVHKGAEGILMRQEWDVANPTLQELSAYLEEKIDHTFWVEKTLVHESRLYAGRGDALVRHKDHGIVLLDFKTQKVRKRNDKWAPSFYPNYARQLAAYAACLTPEPRILSVVINSVEPMAPFEKLYSKEAQEEAKEAFLAIANYWCVDKKYDPRIAYWESKIKEIENAEAN